LLSGGETGIRTLEGVAPLLVFKTSAFNRSAISPKGKYYKLFFNWNVVLTNLGN
tara:strand:- start:386 stop:547 length:162 start_codon:yes stop_codon:yes gene_type:complete